MANDVYSKSHSLLFRSGPYLLIYKITNVADLSEPFGLQKGWLLWAGIGLIGALMAIGLTGAALSLFSGENTPREVRN